MILLLTNVSKMTGQPDGWASGFHTKVCSHWIFPPPPLHTPKIATAPRAAGGALVVGRK